MGTICSGKSYVQSSDVLLEGAMIPVPRPSFVYKSDDIFELVFLRYWREHPELIQSNTLTGQYDDVILSQKAGDHCFSRSICDDFVKWWKASSQKERSTYAVDTINKNLKLGFVISIPDGLINEYLKTEKLYKMDMCFSLV